MRGMGTGYHTRIKRLLPAAALLIFTAALLLAAAPARGGVNFFQMGRQAADTLSKADGGAVALVDGDPISRTSYQIYRDGLSNALGSFTGREVLDKLIRQRLLVQAAIDAGYTVTDEELDGYISDSFALLEQDETVKAQFEAYLSGRGMTMDGYKASMRDSAREMLLYDKLAAGLQAEYAQQPATASDGAPEGFDRYLERYTDALYEAAEIEVLDPSLR